MAVVLVIGTSLLVMQQYDSKRKFSAETEVIARILQSFTVMKYSATFGM